MIYKDYKFCMFILSHGRADKLITLQTLKRCGYTGDYFIVIDNEDKTANDYYEKFGRDKVVMFDKKKRAKTVDTIDNFPGRNAVVYARNECFDLAKRLGYTHFMEIDDDYTAISYRFNNKGQFKNKVVSNLDFIIKQMIELFEKSGAHCLAFAQGGDFIGGEQGQFGKKIFLRRKVMNTMLCSPSRPFKYTGKINEDVNAYVREGIIGKLFFTTNIISINQMQTQANSGGLTDIYLDMGTYVKSFYTVVISPSSVKISMMGNKNMRIHHKVNWRKTIPCILNERYKKV